MECLIDKKGQMSGWSPRCYRLKNCELIQYKRGIESFRDCNDSVIKKRYNIFEIKSVSIGPKTPYILKIEYDTKYQSESISVLLKYNDVGKKRGVDKLAFIAWFRILTATSKLSANPKCIQRPLPTPMAFALYYTLQRLYKHKEILNTPFIFKNKSSKSIIEKQYYRLIVNHKEAYRELKGDKQPGQDINVLAGVLLQTLRNMPTSLFCDAFCEEMVDKVMETMRRAEEKYQPDQNIPIYEDNDIAAMKQKESLTLLKQFFLKKYSLSKKEFKKLNGFALFNRYGFITILVLLLCNISSAKYYNKTKITAAELGDIFKDVLISKRYQYKCRSEQLQAANNKNGYRNKAKTKDEKYERNFSRALKILIYFAKDIFPGFR